MNRRLLYAFLVSMLLGYLLYVGYVFSLGAGHQILAATTDDSYPLVPKRLAKLYMKGGEFLPFSSTEPGFSPISFTIAGVGNGASLDDVKDVVSIFVERGEGINDYQNGMTPLHEAILFGEPRLVEFLLAEGADKNKPIQREGSPVDGMDALRFVRFLVDRDKRKYKDVHRMLDTGS